jgi:hypothetical protein
MRWERNALYRHPVELLRIIGDVPGARVFLAAPLTNKNYVKTLMTGRRVVKTVIVAIRSKWTFLVSGPQIISVRADVRKTPRGWLLLMQCFIVVSVFLYILAFL